MKFNLIILFALCIGLCNCNFNSKNEGTPFSKSDNLKISDTFLEAYDKEIFDCEKLCNDSIFKKSFSFKCINEESIAVDEKLPFNQSIKEKNDTTYYSFNLSNQCCIMYYGNYVAKRDTLILLYNNCGYSCDSYCDYQLTYKIPTEIYKNKYVLIKTSK